MKAMLVLAGATAVLAAVPAAASACSCKPVRHHPVHYAKPAHHAVHYATPVRRAHYARPIVRREVRTVYVTRVVHEPVYGPPPPPLYGPPIGPRFYGPGPVVYHHRYWGHRVYRPDVVWVHPRDDWRADVVRY